MCWKTRNEYFIKKRIAENDIKVYKVVTAMDNGGIYSYFMGKNYGYFDDDEIIQDKSVLSRQFANVQAITQTSCNILYTIVFGYHSYSANVGTSYVNCGNEKAFVVCNTPYQYDEHLRIMECVIPKGTEYYENEHGEIVSELIEIKKIYIPSLKDGSFGEIY